MKKSRLEAFSDGVLAIILTIMVLELKVPHGEDLEAVKPLVPVFLGYVLSFIYVGIYWNNHHHLMHAARSVSGGVMWANLHLLFWLSLVPVLTGWVGENPTAAWPTALYGFMLLMAGIAWLILQTAIVRRDGKDSPVAVAIGRDVKGKVSALFYLSAIGLAFVATWASDALYVITALMWLVPDRRLEAKIVEE